MLPRDVHLQGTGRPAHVVAKQSCDPLTTLSGLSEFAGDLVFVRGDWRSWKSAWVGRMQKAVLEA